MCDWDSIREAAGFKVGDQVRTRGSDVGVIRHFVEVKDGRIRAHIHWPTIPFECEGKLSQGGSENFVDLDSLCHATGQINLI